MCVSYCLSIILNGKYPRVRHLERDSDYNDMTCDEPHDKRLNGGYHDWSVPNTS